MKPLVGTRSAWRLRVGERKGIFEVTGEEIVPTGFAHRSRVDDP